MLIACLLVASLFAAACNDDDDEMNVQQVSEEQAEAVLGAVIPDVLEFSLGVMQIVQASAPAAASVGASIQGSACQPIPGFETEFLCSDPPSGVICPTGTGTSEWQFTSCTVEGDTTMIDGTVMVAGVGPYDLTFDLTIDGQDITGDMSIAFGTCNNATYDNLVLADSGVSASLTGMFNDCGDGSINATIQATGFQTFLAQIVVNDGFALITVTDAQTQEPLYTCTWSPIVPDTADCVSYTGGV